ncbi:MAG: DNA polymerase IV [Archangium sp.]|nr:DNA polymerase IV [Archangium sp.]
MDAFYASVEQRDAPALQGKPVIVGGHPTRGVVLAASYEVRPFGVRSAMPMSRAMRLAPNAIVVPPRFAAYAEASEQVFRIFEHYTPLIEPLSLDEAFLDVTASASLFGAATKIAAELRARVKAETKLACSAGVAETKFVAKIASDFAKPDGLREVAPGTAREFLAPLPVSRLWGVGEKTEAVLRSAGIRLIGDVAARDVAWLTSRLGTSLGHHLWELSQAIDTRAVVPDRDAKSIGARETFDEDLHGLEALKPHVHSLALRVGRRLRRSERQARTVVLTVKYDDFTQVTRQETLPSPTDDGQALYRVAMQLLETKIDLTRKVRLTGVTGTELTGGAPQLSLFTEPPTKRTKLNAALDAIGAKFGNTAVITADLASSDPERRVDGFYPEERPAPAAPPGLHVERDEE